MNSVRFGGKHAIWVRRQTTCSPLHTNEIRITQHVTQRLADKHRQEQMKAKACDVACAPPPAAVFLGGAQVRQLPDSTLRVSRMGGGSPKTPRAEQRRRWSYPSLERILIALGRSLGSLVIVGFGRSSCFKNWACYRHVFNLRRHHRGKLCYGSVGMGAAVAFAATR